MSRDKAGLVARGKHARLDIIGVREFTRLLCQRLCKSFPNLQVPVWEASAQSISLGTSTCLIILSLFRPPALEAASGGLEGFDLWWSANTFARVSYGSNCLVLGYHGTGRGALGRLYGAQRTNIILSEVLDASPVAAWQLHHITLQPAFGGVARDGLIPCPRRGLVISTDPRSQAGVRHLPRDIAVDGSDKLVVEMLLFAILGREDGVDAIGVFGLVETSWGMGTGDMLASKADNDYTGRLPRRHADRIGLKESKQGWHEPMRNCVRVSLYTDHCSWPIAAFRAE